MRINHYPSSDDFTQQMKKIYVLVLLLYLCPIARATPVQPLGKLIKELNDLTPLKRIYRTTKHLDTLLANGTPLPKVAQRIDSLLLFAKKVNDPETAGFLRFYDKVKKGFLPIKSEEVIAVFNAARVYFEKQEDYKYTGVSHFYLAQHHYEQGRYGDAFYHQAKAQELFNKVGVAHIIEISKYLHVMALNCYHFGYYEKVVQLMKASITVSAFNQNLDIQRYNTLALAYKKLNKLDSAAFYFRRTKDVASSYRDTIWIRLSAGNLGGIYAEQGRNQEALPLLMQDYQYNQYQNFHPVLARNAAVSIAGIWQKLGRQDSTLHYLRESERLDVVHKEKEPMWKEQRDEQFHINYYEVFLEYYKAKGNSRMAYDYLDSLTHLRNETNLRYNTMTKKVAEDRLKIEQQLTDFTARELEKERISIGLQCIIGIVGLLAIHIGLLYYMLRLRQSKDSLLAAKENAVRQAAQERMEAQLAEANLELQDYMLRLQQKTNLSKRFKLK